MYYNSSTTGIPSGKNLTNLNVLKRRDLISDNECGVIWRQVDIVSRDKARFRCKDKPLIRRYVHFSRCMRFRVRITRVLYLHTCTILEFQARQ